MSLSIGASTVSRINYGESVVTSVRLGNVPVWSNGIVMRAEAGNVALSGGAASFHRKVRLDAGAIAVTGPSLPLIVKRVLYASPGSLVLGGGDADLRRGKTLQASGGAVAIAGQDAGLRVARILKAEPGNIVLGGGPASLLRSLVLPAASGSIALTGQDANLVAGGLQVSVVSVTSSSAETIAWPSGIQAGDVAFLFDFAARQSGQLNEVVPTGFTKIGGGLPLQYARLCISRKILTGSETGNITGLNGNYSNTKALIVVRGSLTISSVSTSTMALQVTGGDPTPQTVAASGGTAPLIIFGLVGNISDKNVAFSSVSPSFDSETLVAATNNASQRVGYKIYGASPADLTVDSAGGYTENTLASFYAQFS